MPYVTVWQRPPGTRVLRVPTAKSVAVLPDRFVITMPNGRSRSFPLSGWQAEVTDGALSTPRPGPLTLRNRGDST